MNNVNKLLRFYTGLLLYFLVISPPLLAETQQITRTKAKQIIASVKPVVETVTGRSFKTSISVTFKTPKELRSILKEEADWKYKGVTLPVPDARRSDFIKNVNRVYSRSLLGKLAVGQSEIYLVPKNISRLNEQFPDLSLLTERFLKILLTHELVHVMDDQFYDVKSFYSGCETYSDLLVRNAVSEGHAQYVTRKVSDRLGLVNDFKKYTEPLISPPGSASLQDYMQGIFSSDLRFSYKQGHSFWKKLYANMPEQLPDRVYQNPPSSTAMISTPGYYLHPSKFDRSDVKSKISTVVAAAKKQFPEKDWDHRKIAFPRHKLRSALSILPKKAIERGVKHYHSGSFLSVKPKQAPAPQYNFAFMAFQRHAAARQFFALEKQILEAKKKKFQNQSIQFVGSSREQKKMGDNAFLNVNNIKIRGREMTIIVLAILEGKYVLEFNLSLMGKNEKQKEKLIETGKACLKALRSVIQQEKE